MSAELLAAASAETARCVVLGETPEFETWEVGYSAVAAASVAVALVAGMEATSRALGVGQCYIRIVAGPALTLEVALVAAGHRNCRV